MKRILLVLNGETYRIGLVANQHGPSRQKRGGADSVVRQQVATESHLRFMTSVEQKQQLQFDVLVNSYSLNEELDKSFLSSYDSRSRFVNMYANPLPSEEYLIRNTLKLLGNTRLSDYIGVLFCRPDIYLKEYLSNVFVPAEKVIYAHVDLAYDVNLHSIPYVCHSLTYVPNKYFDLMLTDRVWHWHDSAIRFCAHVGRTEVDFFSNTLHMCCSRLDWNPIYAMVGRDETDVYIKPNHRYDFAAGRLIVEDTSTLYSNGRHDTVARRIAEITKDLT